VFVRVCCGHQPLRRAYIEARFADLKVKTCPAGQILDGGTGRADASPLALIAL
jgi:hypothetical protein